MYWLLLFVWRVLKKQNKIKQHQHQQKTVCVVHYVPVCMQAGVCVCVCSRWMNKTLFSEGSGEDSRSFYIQPLPMRETTIN